MNLSLRFLIATGVCFLFGSGALLAHDPHDPIVTVAVSPNFAQDQTVFASTDLLSIKFGVYALMKSTDAGATWSAIGGLPRNTRMQTIAFSPAYAADQTIFIASLQGLFRTSNQGTSWTMQLKNPLASLVLSPNFAVDGTLYAVTTQKTIFRSANRGQNWALVPAPVELTGGLNSIAISPNYAIDNTLLLSTVSDGIFRSTDAGASWTQVTAGTTLPSVTGLAFSPGYVTDKTAFASTYGAGVLISTNGGVTWTPANSGVTDLNATGIALSPTYLVDSTLWITTAVAGVFQSSNLGTSWAPAVSIPRTLSTLTCTHFQALAAAAGSSGNVLFLATYEGLWSSSGATLSFKYHDLVPTRLIRYIHVSPTYAQDRTVFANSYGGGNLWSTTAGQTWTFQNTGMVIAYTDASGISPNFKNDGVAFSGNYAGLEGTNNKGASWKLLEGLATHAYPRGFGISPAFATDSTVLIGVNVEPSSCGSSAKPHAGQPYGVFLSTDAGNTWNPTSLTGNAGISSIAVSPGFATDRTAFAASATQGLYKSVDGGLTWNILKLPTSLITNVAVSPDFATDQVVFAAGLAGGIFKSRNGGTNWTLLPHTTDLRAMDLEVSPNYTKDKSFFAATISQGIVKFTNAGKKSAELTSFPDNFVTAIGISPRYIKDRTIFAASYHGLFKSTDAGVTWKYTAEPARMEESRNVNSLLQEPPSIVYAGNWTHEQPSTSGYGMAAAASSTSAYMLTSEAGDTATLSFSGTGIRWIGWKGPSQGSASIELDGVSKGKVSLNAATDMFQQTIFEQHGLTCGAHTFTLTATPQSGQTVTLDAFDVWVDSCPFSK